MNLRESDVKSGFRFCKADDVQNVLNRAHHSSDRFFFLCCFLSLPAIHDEGLRGRFRLILFLSC